MKLKKVMIGAVIAVFAMTAFAPITSAATTMNVNRKAGLSDLFTLDKLFRNNSKILDNNEADLGSLLILNQLFPVSTAATTATTATTKTSTTVSLATRLSGRILIQVDNKGEAWYVNPVTKKRVFLNGPATAFKEMSNSSIGVTNATFDSLSTSIPSNLVGRFILKTEDAGKLYYVNPVDRTVIFVNGPSGAENLIRTVGLGIKTSDLVKITVAQ